MRLKSSRKLLFSGVWGAFMSKGRETDGTTDASHDHTMYAVQLIQSFEEETVIIFHFKMVG